MIYLNLNKGIVATITNDAVTVNEKRLPYSIVQSVLGSMINKGINFTNVKFLPEDVRNNLKNRDMWRDGETAFIEITNQVKEEAYVTSSNLDQFGF